MKVMRYARFLCAALLGAALHAPTAPAQQDGPPAMGQLGQMAPAPTMSGQILQTMTRSMRLGETIVEKDVESYNIGSEGVVTCQPGSDPLTLIITARGSGKTELLLKKNGYAGYFKMVIEIGGVSPQSLLSNVRRSLGSIVGMRIRQAGEVVELQGDILDRRDGQRIDRQIELYGRGILDMTERVYLAEDLDKMSRAFEREGVRVKPEIEKSPEGYRRLVLLGEVQSETQRQAVANIARQYFLQDKIVDQVTVNSPLVSISVENYTIDLARARKVGDNILNRLTAIQSTGWSFNSGLQSGGRGAGGGQSSGDSFGVSVGAGLKTTLEASLANNVATHAGGQVIQMREGQVGKIEDVNTMIFQVASTDAADVKEVSAGQLFTVMPRLVRDDVFESQIKVEISQFNSAGQGPSDKSLGGRNVIKLETVFQSRQGETVLLGGSRLTRSGKSENRTPFLGRIPILSLFFKASNRDVQERAHISVMTISAPQAVAPRPAPVNPQAVESQTRESQKLLNEQVK